MDREHKLRKQRANSLDRKLKVLMHYGPKHSLRCSWPGCRITDSRMLVLDHKKNDGNEHRRLIGSRSSSRLFAWLIRNKLPPGYQTLCSNHNMLKEWVRRKKDRTAYRESNEAL